MLNNQEKCIKFWLENINSEYDFWNKAVKNNKKSFMTKSYSIIDYNKNLLETNGEVRVLDVGCGPRGAFKDKYQLPDNIKVYSCDPLAFLYKDILEKNNLKYEQEIDFCLAELLSYFYPENFFDYIIIQNALDHSINPQLAFEECLKILKINGVLYLFHEENEAKIRNYSGLHQWNLSLNTDGDFIVSNRTAEINISKIYSGGVNILSERIFNTNDNSSWIKSQVKKTGDCVSQIDNNDVVKVYLKSFMSLIQDKIIASTNNSKNQGNSIQNVLEKIKTTLLYFYSQR